MFSPYARHKKKINKTEKMPHPSSETVIAQGRLFLYKYSINEHFNGKSTLPTDKLT